MFRGRGFACREYLGTFRGCSLGQKLLPFNLVETPFAWNGPPPSLVNAPFHLERFSDSCTWHNGGTSPPAPLQKRGEPNDQYTNLRTALSSAISIFCRVCKHSSRWAPLAVPAKRPASSIRPDALCTHPVPTQTKQHQRAVGLMVGTSLKQQRPLKLLAGAVVFLIRTQSSHATDLLLR